MGINKKLFTGAAAGGLVPSENFDTVIYSGTGATQNITSLSFSPAMIWIKVRNASVSSDHQLFDTVRGPDTNLGILYPNYNGAEDPGGSAYLADTLSNGFTVGSSVYVGGSGRNYVAWCFKGGGDPTADNSGGSSPTSGSIMVDGSAYTTTLTGTIFPKRATANTAAGFSIINYDGSGISNGTLNHFLSAAPELYIWKRISSTSDWSVAGSDINSNQGYMELNDTVVPNTDSTMQVPTSSLIKFNTTSASYNGSGQEWMLYCFHSVAGYSKIGTYTWGGSDYAAGTMVTGLGFTPSFVMIKGISIDSNWSVYDSTRGATSGTKQRYRLAWNSNAAEVTSGFQGIGFDSDGFSAIVGADGNTTGSGGLNKNGETYLYYAIA